MDKWKDNSKAELARLRFCLEEEMEREKDVRNNRTGHINPVLGGSTGNQIQAEKERMMAKLKPCPFCGINKCSVIEHSYHNLSSTYGVKCWNCKAESWQFFDTKEEAIESWNRRAKNEA